MRKTNPFAILTASVCFLILMIDAKYAVLYAQEGISLCLEAVIPSLFPLMVLSSYLSGHISGSSVGKSNVSGFWLFLTGLLGGYPMGAQIVNSACRTGSLSAEDGRRMMAYCSQPGPAFIFGMCGAVFSSRWISWLIWANIVLSAICVQLIFRGIRPISLKNTQQASGISFPQILSRSVRTIGLVCGWIVLFKILIGFLCRWFLWIIPLPWQIFISGFFELSNGCYALQSMENQAICYVLANVLLAWGGLCVLMQTRSVSPATGLGLYIPGKLLQSLIILFLSLLTLPLISNNGNDPAHWTKFILIIPVLILVFAYFMKKWWNSQEECSIIG